MPSTLLNIWIRYCDVFRQEKFYMPLYSKFGSINWTQKENSKRKENSISSPTWFLWDYISMLSTASIKCRAPFPLFVNYMWIVVCVNEF